MNKLFLCKSSKRYHGIVMPFSNDEVKGPGIFRRWSELYKKVIDAWD